MLLSITSHKNLVMEKTTILLPDHLLIMFIGRQCLLLDAPSPFVRMQQKKPDNYSMNKPPKLGNKKRPSQQRKRTAFHLTTQHRFYTTHQEIFGPTACTGVGLPSSSSSGPSSSSISSSSISSSSPKLLGTS